MKLTGLKEWGHGRELTRRMSNDVAIERSWVWTFTACTLIFLLMSSVVMLLPGSDDTQPAAAPNTTSKVISWVSQLLAVDEEVFYVDKEVFYRCKDGRITNDYDPLLDSECTPLASINELRE